MRWYLALAVGLGCAMVSWLINEFLETSISRNVVGAFVFGAIPYFSNLAYQRWFKYNG